ncbi:hypothetical protein [Streptomyces sp. NPDC059916]|uniref:hypothetical protein n=1 Tax=Streptomyces sp. NPDC059916 TaxID=3347001 RepID=UPI00369CF289
MRRPAQHDTAWSHPYTGLDSLAVFYNDGGDPATSPAPAAQADPPKPGPPPGPAKEFSQEDLDRIAAREKAQGKRSALKDFAEEHGFNSPEDAAAFIAAARQSQQDALSEDERRRQALEQREQDLVAKEAAAVARERAAIRKFALQGLGATGADLEDALALLERDLRESPDADEATVITAAEALKERRAALFGTTAPAAQPVGTLPPAPGGSPAGGPPRTAATKDDVNERMRKKAVAMGLRTDAA